MRMMTSVLTFALGGVSRYFLNAFTPRVVSRATAVNGTNRRLGTLGNGFGVGSIYREHRLKQSFGSYPLFSISWIGSYRGGKTPKAVENFQRRAVISSSSKETKPKDTKVNLVLASDRVCAWHALRSFGQAGCHAGLFSTCPWAEIVQYLAIGV